MSASNEPDADAGAVIQSQSAFSYQSIWTSKSVTGIDAFFVLCCRPRNRPSAMRSSGSRRNDISAFDPARWYMNRTYSPLSISDAAKLMSRFAVDVRHRRQVGVVDHAVAVRVGPQVAVVVDVGPVVGQQAPRLVAVVVRPEVELFAREVQPDHHQVGVGMLPRHVP